MITVEMPNDIRKFEAKFMGPFTLRQTICVVIGAAIAIPIALLLPLSEATQKFMAGSFLMLPFLAAGWYKPDGMNFEVWAMRMIYYRFLTPNVRKAKMDNSYYRSYQRVLKAKEKRKLKAMSDKERKQYEKQKKNNTIIRSKKARYKVYQ